MSSPFPGMDPYLENPIIWPDVHHEFISVAREALGRQLRPKYYVSIEERVYISDEDDPGQATLRIPDLRVTGVPNWNGGEIATGGVATMDAVLPMEIVIPEDEIHEARLEVIDAGNKQVVTVIELVSPSNKISGSRGRESYGNKRLEVKNSPSHWVEIDLLRVGVPFLPRNVVPPHEYLVHVSRYQAGARRRKSSVWAIQLPQVLPPIDIPLKPEDPDAKLDLQAALNVVYDRASFDLRVDYQSEAVPPLPPQYVEWTDQLLKAKGLR